MKYRTFGSLEWKVSALGFGAMRLPVIDQDRANIDEAESIKMMRYAINQGVNYVDTAYPYHDGNSEIVVGKALKNGYRDKVRLATKLPTWLVTSQADMDTILEKQLEKLQVDYIDFYLLHALERERWAKMQKLEVFDWAEAKMKEGKIRYLGFSFHDDFKVFKEIVDGFDHWTFCQIHFNYIDAEYQAGTRGLKYAALKGLAVVVMEPIAGGLLAFPPPKEIQTIWDEAESTRSPAEWALQWVWNHPEVSVVLSGMSTMDQVVENVSSASRSAPGSLSEAELQFISRVREQYSDLGMVGCTGCRYCIPCPQGVDIPGIFSFYNLYFMRGRDQEVVEEYKKTMPSEVGAKNCVKCGDCEEKCPQQLPIRNLLAKTTFLFEQDN